MEKFKEIERSIIKTFRKDIWGKFASGINEYELIQEGDHVAVCISGGKDSMLLAKCMQELKRHGKVKFDVSFIVMDPGYSKEHRLELEKNAELLNIPVIFFETDIFNIVSHVSSGSPCYLCARMRRGNLYNKAKELGCNKIALGHHYDDVIETILLSMFYAGEVRTMMPKLHSTNFEEMQLIRPLYLVKEESIINWQNYNKLKFLNCACNFTRNIVEKDKESDSKRLEMKKLIKQLKKTNPLIDINIFRSVENVNIDAIVGFKKDREKHCFLDNY